MLVANAIRTVILALIWAALQGAFSPLNLLMGLIVGGLVVGFMRPMYHLVDTAERIRGPLRIVVRIWRSLVLLLVFLWELIQSSLQVAYLVLQPSLKGMQPGVIAYPLGVRSGLEITALANLISLTPGTLSIDVSDDRTVLYIHSILVRDEEATEVRNQIKRTLEKHVARAFGPYETDAPTPDDDA